MNRFLSIIILSWTFQAARQPAQITQVGRFGSEREAQLFIDQAKPGFDCTWIYEIDHGPEIIAKDPVLVTNGPSCDTITNIKREKTWGTQCEQPGGGCQEVGLKYVWIIGYDGKKHWFVDIVPGGAL